MSSVISEFRCILNTQTAIGSQITFPTGMSHIPGAAKPAADHRDAAGEYSQQPGPRAERAGTAGAGSHAARQQDPGCQ